MGVRTKIFLLIGALLATVITYTTYKHFTANGMEVRLRSDQPFAVRLALIDDADENALETFLQAVIYPKQKHVVFVFLNTAAHFEGKKTPIRRSTPSRADYFRNYTGIATQYHISVRARDAARLIDLAEGIPIFIEEPLFFKGARFQYPRGTEVFPGEKAMEYALGRIDGNVPDPFGAAIQRLYRQESLLLNVLWRMRDLRKNIPSKNFTSLARSLTDTNMNIGELNSLFAFLGEDLYTSLLEVPIKKGMKTNANTYYINEKSARILYYDFRDNLKSGLVKSDTFSVAVLNGTEQNRLANRVKQFLREKGPAVLEASNYKYAPILESAILERSGSTYRASFLADKMRMKREKIFFSRKTVQVKVTIILGEDFKIKQLRL